MVTQACRNASAIEGVRCGHVIVKCTPRRRGLHDGPVPNEKEENVQGVNALVVEEEYLIAADIEQTLRAAGAREVQIYPSVSEIGSSIPPGRYQLAIVEAKLGHPDVIALTEHLRRLGVGVVVTSADRAVQALFTGAVGLEKPFDSGTLLKACEAARTAPTPSPVTGTWATP
jgi:hypothetical protein